MCKGARVLGGFGRDVEMSTPLIDTATEDLTCEGHFESGHQRESNIALLNRTLYGSVVRTQLWPGLELDFTPGIIRAQQNVGCIHPVWASRSALGQWG
jgi:hypothetical protein